MPSNSQRHNIWLNNKSLAMLMQPAIKCCLMLLLLRFMLPTSALISDSLYRNWLQPDIEDAVESLKIVSDNYNQMSNMPPEQKGFFSSMTTAAADKVEKTSDAFLNMIENAENIISALLQLMTAYLTIFIVQVLLLPLFMLWLLVSLLFRSKVLNSFSA